MRELNPLQRTILPYIFVAVTFGLFVTFFAANHEIYGNAVAALAIVPIIVGSWCFGVRGGALTAIFSILSYTVLRVASGQSFVELFAMPSAIIGAFALIVVGLVSGGLATLTRERREAFITLARSNELIRSLLIVATHIEHALSPVEIIQALGEELRQINLSCGIALFDNDHKLFTIHYLPLNRSRLDELEKAIGVPLEHYKFSPNVSDLRVENALQPAIVSNPRGELQIFFPLEDAKAIANILLGYENDLNVEILRLPLMFEENVLGMLWVWGSGVSASDLPVMSIFAKQIGISLERARLFQEVQDLALTDHLTSLHNRRSLFELGRIEFSRAERFKRPFCCLMLDLDHFKQINDEYGHQIGDLALQEFAKLCKDSVREIDLVGRYGGEELTILMPETELETAIQVAERLRLITSEKEIVLRDRAMNLTVSIGVATKNENTTELETLIARADQAMYIAKHKGRNRVAVSK